MNRYLAPIITIILVNILFYLIFFRKKPISFQNWMKLFLFPFLLVIVIPYHQVERILLNIWAGFLPVLSINTFLVLIELILLSVSMYFLIKITPKRGVELFPYFLLIGLGLGCGRFFRNVILVWYHPLNSFFGYGQFSNFITGFYIVQEVLQLLIVIVCSGYMGLGFIRFMKGQFSKGIMSIIFSFLMLEIDALVRVLFQYVPFFAFFSAVYVISILPLLFILGGLFLWMSYRRQEKKELEIKKENSKLVSGSSGS
ncbi:MAG: hypothetical protein KBG67_05190 [Candidatus Atribacteria bacterium]|nr:hypothetical protein [Candidatus Atribacteria bacterium]